MVYSSTSTRSKSSGRKGGKYVATRRPRAFGYRDNRPGPVRSLHSEMKCVDTNNFGSPPVVNVLSTTFTAVCLNPIAIGTDSWGRIGRRIQMMSVRVHGKIAFNDHTAVDDYARIMVVYDRESKHVAPLQNDLFEGIDTGGNVSNTVWDDDAVGSFGRLDILANIRIDYSGPGTTQQSSGAITDYKGEYNIDRYIKLKGLTANYGSTNNIPETGSLYLVTLGSIAAASAPMAFEWTARLRYTDC